MLTLTGLVALVLACYGVLFALAVVYFKALGAGAVAWAAAVVGVVFFGMLVYRMVRRRQRYGFWSMTAAPGEAPMRGWAWLLNR